MFSRSIIDDSGSRIDDSSDAPTFGVIYDHQLYDCHIFIVQAIDMKRITRCKLALIFTSADHRKFLGLFGSEAARL